MPLTDGERARLRAMWLRLCDAAETLDPAAMRDVSADVLGLKSPLDDKAAAFTLFSFSRLAFAYVRGGAGYRLKAGGALRALAELAREILYLPHPGEPAAAAPPRLPYIDG